MAFAGRRYAARSLPQIISDADNTVTTLTLVKLNKHEMQVNFFHILSRNNWFFCFFFLQVLEFQEGTLLNLYWKSFGCEMCGGDASVCLNQTVCAVPNEKCKKQGGPADCNLSIQLTFSGTDDRREVLNSWYEVENLRKLSLFDL